MNKNTLCMVQYILSVVAHDRCGLIYYYYNLNITN